MKLRVLTPFFRLSDKQLYSAFFHMFLLIQLMTLSKKMFLCSLFNVHFTYLLGFAYSYEAVMKFAVGYESLGWLSFSLFDA